MQDEIIFSPVSGKIIPLGDVDDGAFSSGVLGMGAAIEPSVGKLFSPADGCVDNLFDTNHAVSIKTDNGAEILIHIGIDTVKLNGKFYTPSVKNGQKIKKGDLLISFDIAGIKMSGYKVTTPIVICNGGDYSSVKLINTGKITAGAEILKLKKIRG